MIAAINGPAAGAGLLAGARLRHPDRLRERLLRLRLRPDRRLARRRHDLLPAARGRAEPGAGAAARGPQHDRPPTRSPRGWSPRSWRPTTLMERARAKAGKLAAMAPHYVKMAKRLCGVSIENSLTEHLQLERHGIADSMATEDLREGVDRLLRRREARVPRPLNRRCGQPVSGLQSVAVAQSSTGRFRHEEGRSRIRPRPRLVRARRLRQLVQRFRLHRRRNQRTPGQGSAKGAASAAPPSSTSKRPPAASPSPATPPAPRPAR